MPVSLTVRATGFDDLKRRLSNLQKLEVPFAAARAATDVAFMARDAVKQEMKKVFEAPTRWTLGGMVVDKANHKTGKPAVVRFEEFSKGGTPAGYYLQPQMKGGPRPPTPFEQRLILSGVLRPGEFLVPGRFAERDASGNLNLGQIQKIMSDLGANEYARKGPNWRNRGVRRDEHYELIRGGAGGFYGRSVASVPPGIYLRAGRTLLLIFRIVRQPTYRQILFFEMTVKRTVEREFAAAFRKNLDRAWASSRNNPANMSEAA